MRWTQNLRPVRLRNFAAAGALVFGGCLSIDSPPVGIALLTVVSGNEQIVQPGATTAAPLVVRAFDSGTAPVAGATITWTVTSGGGTVSQQSTVTDGAGQASINYTAGPTAGAAQVRATTEGLTVTFTITIAATGG